MLADNCGLSPIILLEVFAACFIGLLLTVKWPDIKRAWRQAEAELDEEDGRQ